MDRKADADAGNAAFPARNLKAPLQRASASAGASVGRRARRASAEVVRPPVEADTASFGTTVTLRRDDGREQTFRIVGEDEADPSRGTVSYVSPVARAVMTCRPGRYGRDSGRRGRDSGRAVEAALSRHRGG